MSGRKSDQCRTLTGRVGGKSGVLEGELRGEAIGLAGGRFDFDFLSSIALDQPVVMAAHPHHVTLPFHVRDLARTLLPARLTYDMQDNVVVHASETQTVYP
ncbi:MAG: hypothetical protein GY856_09160 [bacterium]|nr:hypothetical protein [bacterium]